MSRWRTETFEDAGVADRSSKMKSALPNSDHVLINRPARQAFNGAKKSRISEYDNETVLDVICADAVITATIELLKKIQQGKTATV